MALKAWDHAAALAAAEHALELSPEDGAFRAMRDEIALLRAAPAAWAAAEGRADLGGSRGQRICEADALATTFRSVASLQAGLLWGGALITLSGSVAPVILYYFRYGFRPGFPHAGGVKLRTSGGSADLLPRRASWALVAVAGDRINTSWGTHLLGSSLLHA